MLLVALAFAVVGAQVFLFNWRGGFRKWTMYGPVLLSPAVVVAGVVGAIMRDGWLGLVVLAIFAFGIVEGFVGIFEHFRGIAERIGGFSLRKPDERAATATAGRVHGFGLDWRARPHVEGVVKALDELGDKERAIVEERRTTGYRKDALEHFGGELEATLRALIERLVPRVPDSIDLAAFVDTHVDNPIGRGDRGPDLPPVPELLQLGLEALSARDFAQADVREQDELIQRMRRGEADELLGLPAKEFVDRLLVKALAGYLAHPDTWERIGFNGPAYPGGYAWLSPAAVVRRHERFPGAARL